MKSWTVVLRRPQAVLDQWDMLPFDEDRAIYVAHITDAPDVLTAIKEAKKEARRWDSVKGVKAREYITLVVFKGRQEPIAYGWSTGVDE